MGDTNIQQDIFKEQDIFKHLELEIISVYYLQRYGEHWQQLLEDFIEQLPFSDILNITMASESL